MEKSSRNSLILFFLIIIGLCSYGIYYFSSREEEKTLTSEPVVNTPPESTIVEGYGDVVSKIKEMYDYCPSFLDENVVFKEVPAEKLFPCLNISPLTYNLNELVNVGIINQVQLNELLLTNNVEVESIEIDGKNIYKYSKSSIIDGLKDTFNVSSPDMSFCTELNSNYYCSIDDQNLINNIIYNISDVAKMNLEYTIKIDICYFNVATGKYTCSGKEYGMDSVINDDSGLTKSEMIAKEYGVRYIMKMGITEGKKYYFSSIYPEG